MSESNNNSGQPVSAPVKMMPKEVEKVDFDTWFSMREDKIARHHRKEIIKADFKANKMSDCESIADFDKALNKYGVKLD